MRTGSLCSGYEGLGLAVHAVLGGELAWVADTDPGAAAVLAYRFPSVPNLGDISRADWSSAEPVDLLTAGFPCQDVSCAGARKGLRAGTRTGVWSYVAEAIGVLRPPLVFLENVRRLLSAGADSDMEPCPWCLGDSGDESALRALGAVLGDLADLGFDAEWQVVSAADAGAPHRRERVFILAWPAADTELREGGQPDGHSVERGRPGDAEQTRLGDRGTPFSWGSYGPAVARWESVTGRPAPRPTEPGKTAERLSPRFVEWLMGLPDGWVTDVPGLNRNAMLKILGNGVVPAQGALALRLLLDRSGLAEAGEAA